MLTKSCVIYLLLLAWLFAGAVVDAFLVARPAWLPVADLTHMVALVIFAVAWCCADADANGHPRPSGWTVVALVFLVPLGLAIYFFRTRRVLTALGHIAAFLAGCLASVYAGTLLGDQLVWLA